jgi:adenine deaminase
LATPGAFLKYAISGGTTTIITETLEPYPVAGLAGVIDFLESLKDQPVKFFATAPVKVSISAAAKGIPAEDLRQLLEREDIIGLGESYWQAVIQEPERFLPAITQTQRAQKSLEGHTAGASGRNLMAYLTTGISSCHEPIRAEEVLERLRLGMHVMVREGGVRRDLEEIAKIKDMGVDLRRLILVSDSIGPGDLLEKGYMEYIVQKAIDCGFSPVTAIQMATLNVAEHFRLDHLIGGIAPGRCADMLIIPDIQTIRAQYVISNGQIIAKDGELLVSPRSHTFRHKSLNSIQLREELKPEDFIIRAPAGVSKARVRIIEMVTDLVTKEVDLEVQVTDGQIRANVEQNILKVAAVDRTIQPGKKFVGLVKGFGMQSGGLACSAAWDTTDIVVVGADDSDMALAINRIAKLQGGAVICNNGEILEELPLPVFGTMCDLPLQAVDRKLTAIKSAAGQLGIPFPEPVLTLITLTGAAIPFLRICEEGLVNLKNGHTVGLFIKN